MNVVSGFINGNTSFCCHLECSCAGLNRHFRRELQKYARRVGCEGYSVGRYYRSTQKIISRVLVHDWFHSCKCSVKVVFLCCGYVLHIGWFLSFLLWNSFWNFCNVSFFITFPIRFFNIIHWVNVHSAFLISCVISPPSFYLHTCNSFVSCLVMLYFNTLMNVSSWNALVSAM